MISVPASFDYHVLYIQTICNQPTTYKKPMQTSLVLYLDIRLRMAELCNFCYQVHGYVNVFREEIIWHQCNHQH